MADSDPPMPQSTVMGAIRHGSVMDIRTIGRDRRVWTDAYYQLMRLSWPRLTALFVTCFMSFNLVFAGLYALDPAGLATPHDGVILPAFWRDFFFSVHTVATIGYGNVYPVSVYCNVLVVVEITLGILFFALTTGIVFARFSRPTARILFSEVAVVRDLDGTPALMLRAANQRHNLIFSATVRVSVLEDAQVGGTLLRRFRDLPLVRDSNPVFALSWTVIHMIDDQSPLWRWLDGGGAPDDAEVVVVLSGIDESSSQPIYGRTAYTAEHIRWNARFVDIISRDDAGRRVINYARFHETEPHQMDGAAA